MKIFERETTELSSAVFVESYGDSERPGPREAENPKVAILRDGHFAFYALAIRIRLPITKTLAGEMGRDNAPNDSRVPRELELIPVSQLQKPKQEMRGEPIVNNSQIAEFVRHLTKQNVRTRLLAVFNRAAVAVVSALNLNRGPARSGPVGVGLTVIAVCAFAVRLRRS